MSTKHKMFKLISGEFIIATVNEQKDDVSGEIILDTPFVVHFTAAPNGQLGINLFPLNPFASKTTEKIPIDRNHIMFEIDNVHDQIVKQYLEITSGIVLAKENDLPPLEIE
jgi:hypothetical protein